LTEFLVKKTDIPHKILDMDSQDQAEKADEQNIKF
jgi:hypothetical protein